MGASASYTSCPKRKRYGDHTCSHCGCLPYVHHRDGRCYTTEEMGQRLQVFQQTGRWPLEDELNTPGQAEEACHA